MYEIENEEELNSVFGGINVWCCCYNNTTEDCETAKIRLNSRNVWNTPARASAFVFFARGGTELCFGICH